MSKIDLIDYCGDCSNKYYKDNGLYCELTDKEIYENNLPDWCPLPEPSNRLAKQIRKLIINAPIVL